MHALITYSKGAPFYNAFTTIAPGMARYRPRNLLFNCDEAERYNARVAQRCLLTVANRGRTTMLLSQPHITSTCCGVTEPASVPVRKVP
jgi:hypothetical protein